MVRKTLAAVAAAAALAGAALAPTAASAHGFRFHSHVGWGGGIYAPSYVVAADCFWVKRYTPFGIRFVKRCVY